MESFDPQQQPLTINDDVEIVIDNDQQSLQQQQQRQQSIRSHSQQSTILKTGYNLPSTPIIQQQQQQSGIINRKSLQKRPTPPLPVELIRPPIIPAKNKINKILDSIDEKQQQQQFQQQQSIPDSSMNNDNELLEIIRPPISSRQQQQQQQQQSTSIQMLSSSSNDDDYNFQQQQQQITSATLRADDCYSANSSSKKTSTVASTGYLLSTNVSESSGFCAFALTIISIILIVCTLPFSLFLCIKVVQEYERAVIFRLGRLVRGGAKGPGIFFIIPCIDSYCKVDLRTVSFDVPPQEILSRDSVTVSVDAVVYFRISNATVAVSNVEDYGRSTRLLAATTLRNVLGTKDLSQILSERESISHVMQSSLDEATDPWGVKVERVEIKDVRLPVQLQRAMAAEAEAAREARAKVIAAEGEQRASQALRQAAEVMSGNPAALQLRYLQTLSSIAAEKNSTIVFPIPLELFKGMIKA
ncbi:hypothetical protein DERP_003481 [Dermatophagoides pteronyssinus]|uniref:Band 7 domain-containing protein n=1 Tax=Dermatophagoides pteronyssinus TaxID=6956 RepID=A0ABQ8JKR3_DERPT|nr:hypothetical protein DERP_003481 [Dermatophagoides pteronyssinus]